MHFGILWRREGVVNVIDFHFDLYRNDLDKRTFKTYDFYRKLQDNITPAGLAFFQSDWDTNVTQFYHNVLNRTEPIYEYDFPKHYIAPEKHFALRQPFNLYLDRYRDPKQVRKDDELRPTFTLSKIPLFYII